MKKEFMYFIVGIVILAICICPIMCLYELGYFTEFVYNLAYNIAYMLVGAVLTCVYFSRFFIVDDVKE